LTGASLRFIIFHDGRRRCLWLDIYFARAPEKRISYHLYICFRLADGSWSQAHKSAILNTEDSDWCPAVSPDGKYLFFTRKRTGKGDIYWVDAKIIEELRPKE
jgi:hypothetical protein